VFGEIIHMATINIHYRKAPDDEYPVIQLDSYSSPQNPFIKIADATLVQCDGVKAVIFTPLIQREKMSIEDALKRLEPLAISYGVTNIYVKNGK
jgi:hypothetical protein